MEPNRINPLMPVQNYKTYSVSSPVETHWRKATCEEADCAAFLNGWTTTVDEATNLGQFQADYIRKTSGRGFVEDRTEAGLTRFTFHAGQKCFASDTHQVPTGRAELYVVRGGDWRGNPRGDVMRHSSAQAWVDDFGEHQEVLADKLKEG